MNIYLTPAAVVVLPFLAVASLQRRWLLVALVLTAPFQSLTVVEFVSHEFFPSEIVLLILTGRQAITWIINAQFTFNSWNALRWHILFGCVCVLSVVSAVLYLPDVLVHPYNIGGFGTLEFRSIRLTSNNVTQLFLRLFFVVGVFAIANSIKHVEELRRLIRWFVLTGVFVSLIGISYQIIIIMEIPVIDTLRWVGFGQFDAAPNSLGPIPRMYSLPGEPGFTGDYLLYALAISVVVLITTGDNIVFSWGENVPITAFLMLGVLLSTGTTAYGGLLILAALIVAGASVFWRLRTPILKRIIMSGIAAVPFGFVLDTILFSGTFRKLVFYQIEKLTFGTGSGSIRLEYMISTLDIIKTRPLLGVGVGSHHVPSLLFTVAAEVGLLGLIIFLMFHFSLYRQCGWVANNAHKPYAGLALPLFIGGSTLILTNLIAKSVATLLFPWYWLSLAFPLALISFWQTKNRNDHINRQ